MNKKWRVAAIAVIGVMVIGVAVQGSPKNTEVLRMDGTPTGIFSELIPMDTPSITMYSIQSQQNVATGGGAEAVVYHTSFAPGEQESGFFINMRQSTGLVFPGFFAADNMTLGAGFAPGDGITSYTSRFFRSSADPLDTLTDFRLELWDGDPANAIDTIGAGYSCMPIPGTAADFVGVPQNFRIWTAATLGKGVTAPNQRVWMVVTAMPGSLDGPPCRLGWITSHRTPTVGTAAPDDYWLWQVDTDGSESGIGTCCDDGLACVFTGNPCAATGEFGGTDRGFCSDDDAEDLALTWWGGPCTGDPATDNCANFTATIRAPAKVTMTLQPVDGVPLVGITGNEMVLGDVGGKAKLEFQIGDWDPDNTGTELKAFQSDLDSSGYTTGDSGYLTPELTACSGFCDGGVSDGEVCIHVRDCGTCTDGVNVGNVCREDADCGTCLTGPSVGLACVEDADCGVCTGGTNDGGACTEDLDCPDGGVCTITPDDCDMPAGICEMSPCDLSTGNEVCRGAYDGRCGGFTLTPGAACVVNDDCPDIVPGVMVGICTGPVCAYPTGIGGFCEPGYILASDANYVFSAQADLPAVDLSTPDFRYASAVTSPGVPQADADPWLGDKYSGTLRLDVSADAKGTFTVGMFPSSVLVDQDSVFIPLVGLIPGLVTIQTGQCCIDLAGDGGCIDGMTGPQCFSMADPPYNMGPVNFDPTKTCADACIECLSDNDCKETPTDDLCTDNACCLDPAGCAGGKALYFCMDPTVHDCSDGLFCTVDLCDPDTGCYYEDVIVDDQLDCTTDWCDEDGDVVVNDPMDVDDGDPCTVDLCCEGGLPAFECEGPPPLSGVKVNKDVTEYPCPGGMIDCPPEAQGCALGWCFCDPCPRDDVYFDVTETCAQEGTKIGVDVMKPQSGSSVTGAQGTVYWDPTCVEFVSMEAMAPFDYTLPYHGTMGDGSIFFAVGVNPFGDGMGIGDPSPFVHLQFTKIGECNSCNFTLGGVNPFDFILEAEGQNCDTGWIPSDDVIDEDAITLTVPDGAEVNADCDFPTAIVTWDPPSCTAECGDCEIDCDSEHDGGVPIDHLIMGGGEFPQGTSYFTCTATSIGWPCPAPPITKVWTVAVSDMQTLDVTIQLSPIMVGDVTRCIKFELFENCIAPPTLVNMDLFFGGVYDWLGHYTSEIKVSKGQFGCITARDQHHSLRAVDYPACDGGLYSAVFKGDPYFGGNWLVQGNLDGWKKDNPLASHDVIDILDFGQFVANFWTSASLNSGCDLMEGHADIDGSGFVDEVDFSFVAMNFLEASKDACCGAVAGNTVPITSISVRELRASGMEEMITADINHDGMVDTADVSAFLAGDRPTNSKGVRGERGLRR